MMSTSAKPLTVEVPKYHRMNAVMSVDTFESKIEFQARSKPASMAAGRVLPARSSSLVRSKMRMLASTAMPTESTKRGDTRQRQGHRDGPEQGVVDERVEDQCDTGDDARQPVVDEHEGEHEADADEAREHGLGEEAQAERGAQRC